MEDCALSIYYFKIFFCEFFSLLIRLAFIRSKLLSIECFMYVILYNMNVAVSCYWLEYIAFICFFIFIFFCKVSTKILP